MIHFSIIIPTFNRRAFLNKAIQSVLQQTHPHWELIIVDDGSTDDTRSFVSSFNDERIVYHFQDNQGVAHARNQGIKKARYEWMVFLDSDDWFVSDKLSRTMDFMSQHPDIKVFHTHETWYRHGNVLEQRHKHRNPDGWVYQNLLPICCVSMSTLAVHRSVIDAVGVFDETFEACEDYDWLLRITHRYPVKLIPYALTKKEGGRQDQLSLKTWGMDRFRIRALCKMLETGDLNDDEYAATFHELKKKVMIFIKGAQKRNKTEDVIHYQSILKNYGRTQNYC